MGYVASQIIILGMYFYVSYKVKQKNDQTVLKYGQFLSSVFPAIYSQSCSAVDAQNPMVSDIHMAMWLCLSSVLVAGLRRTRDYDGPRL